MRWRPAMSCGPPRSSSGVAAMSSPQIAGMWLSVGCRNASGRRQTAAAEVAFDRGLDCELPISSRANPDDRRSRWKHLLRDQTVEPTVWGELAYFRGFLEYWERQCSDAVSSTSKSRCRSLSGEKTPYEGEAELLLALALCMDGQEELGCSRIGRSDRSFRSFRKPDCLEACGRLGLCTLDLR